MTKKEFLTAVAEGKVTDEVVAKAKEMLETGAEAAVARAKKAAEKKAAEDAPLVEKATEMLAEADGVVLASQVAEALEVSTSKATVVLKKVEGVQTVDVKVKGGRTVKGYFVG